ncbi:MAG: hypothetical protein K2J42_01945 [Muribaculaceae bacterium]|nr:hypothetical protein [Muribaculaceae bacterium]MDE6808832.1 hypothetical protein [Muribaculaceae bacterium]
MNFNDLKKTVIDFFKSVKGRNCITLLIFVAIATFFWVLMALNDELQRDFELPVSFDNVPSDVTLLNSQPVVLNVSLKDKGSSMIRYGWGKPPTVQFDFNDVKAKNDKIIINPLKINNAIRGIFGQATVVALKPDSVMIPFTRRPGKIVKVRVETGDITTSGQYVVSGNLRAETDTVRLFSSTKIPANLRTVDTEPINAEYLTDTTRIQARIIPPEGMIAIPSTVTVMIPVEPLVAREITVPVEVANAPRGKTVVTFPSSVKVSFLLPMSVYNNTDESRFVVSANYSKRSSTTSRMPLTISGAPTSYHNIELHTDSVEYLIEQHQ